VCVRVHIYIDMYVLKDAVCMSEFMCVYVGVHGVATISRLL